MPLILRRQIIRVLISLLLGHAVAFAQSFVPTGDAELDKRTWLADQPELTGSPSISVNKGPVCNPDPSKPPNCTIMSGVLWPTLVQVQGFLASYPGTVLPRTTCSPAPLCISGGSERGHTESNGASHANGFKVDLLIADQDQSNTSNDPLSTYVSENAPFSGSCRGNDNAPLYDAANGVVFALEFPNPSQTACPHLTMSAGNHWDVQSSYSGLGVTPSTFDVKIGDTMPLSPVANASAVPIPNIQPWMFDYSFPVDPQETIATIDRTGSITGTAGTVIALSVGSSELLVSEGPYYGLVQITVNPPDPPGGAPQCPVLSGPCWQWDPTGGPNGTGAWIWNPGQISIPPLPNPPGNPPPPGSCANGGFVSTQTGCWVWVPNPVTGGGSWVFIPPPGRPIAPAPPITVTPGAPEDPNSIAGPLGVGAAQYVTAASPFTYSVFYENSAAATLPAQQVAITDVIDQTRFDLSSVTLGPMIFSGQVTSPPAIPLASLGTFATDVDLRPTTNLIVHVTAVLNSSTGVLTWTLQSIDPTSGQPPSNPAVGFLLPGAGGAVLVTANAISSLATGTVLSNQATIVFDQNPAIATPNRSNTLDVTPPVSSVAPLPASEASANFTVSWTGTDVGSGVSDFTIYVSDNGGTFTPWLSHVSATHATFIGAIGHTYRFYSIARDLTGNIENAKTTGEATTTVVVPCAANTSSNVTVTRSGFRLNLAAQRYVQTVALKNNGTTPIVGPVSLALDQLSSNASLYNENGITICGPTVGSPFINLNLGTIGTLSAGATTTVTLQFADPTNQGITYNTRVLAGTGTR